MMILLMDLFLNAHLTPSSFPVGIYGGSYSDLHFTKGLEDGYIEQTRSSMVERVTRARNNRYFNVVKHDYGDG
jgi:hypothetical protein